MGASDFQFDPHCSFDENIDGFIQHLSSTDPDFASILQDAIPAMLPLCDDKVRTNQRIRFHTLVAERLDAAGAGESLSSS